MVNWYGWFIEQSFEDKFIFKELSTVKMKSEEENWKEHIVELPDDKLEETLAWLTKKIKPTWYAHIVKGNKIIVIYRNKVFRLNQGESFKEIANYGRSVGIIEDQLPSENLFKLARDSGF